MAAEQRLAIRGAVFEADDDRLQAALALVYDTPERPRCLCVPGGIDMYVARHRRFLVKRMPETGCRHAPSCPSYEPDAQQSGLGELLGDAVLEREPGKVELRVDFPWTRTSGRSVARGDAKDVAEVGVARRHMSLRALTHYLFERAGFNRWSPAMDGRRNQGVLHKYLLEAAQDVTVKGVALVDRLYVPEPFSEARKADAAQRRREKLGVLVAQDGQLPLAIVLGEYKADDTCPGGRRVWIKHMPDAPLLVVGSTWDRIEKRFRPLFEARDADTGQQVKLVITALIRARREHTYEIDVASVMLTSEHWIPIEGVHELPLVHALVEQRRRFIKPLRYDARSGAQFPSVLLLDAGPSPVPMYVVSPFADAKVRNEKDGAAAGREPAAWRWSTGAHMPPIPPANRGIGPGNSSRVV
nr:DUF1173 family protein [uncultured Roseateles sp.]